MKERIKQYLADGLKASQVASVVGCSPAYISQLLKNPDFVAEIEALKVDQNKGADQLLETKYEALESQIVSEISNRLGEAEFPHLTKALEAVTKARESKDKRRDPSRYAAVSTVTVVPIYVPPHALQAPVMQLNAQGEVVSIDNKPLAPLSSEGVKSLFSQIQERKEASKKEQVTQNDPLSALISATKTASATPADF